MVTVMGVAKQVDDLYNRLLRSSGPILMHTRAQVVQMLADKLGRRPQWVYDQLRLCELPLEIQELIDNESISYANAITLTRVPAGCHNMFILDAMILSNYNFVKKTREEVRKLRSKVR